MPKKRKSVSFIVRGWGAFPLDMLRYDSCWPKGPRDVEAMMDSELVRDEKNARLERNVELTSESPYSPNEKRWASFSWPVIAKSDNR